ncbi:hypothetical protein TSUD_117790 [Trifolium subterraneum]|nr:hypothetical protein TSUD_117790 [Trifolium subterraneum]
MSTEAQTVVVIQDASRDVGLKAIEKALKKLSVKAGDQLIIIAIFNWFSSPSMFSFFGRKSLGYMVSVDSSYFVSSNKKIISENLTRRKNDYPMNRYINKLSDYCQMNEIEFQLEVHAGPASQVISDAAAKFQPTTLILDKITSDNSLEKLKDPKSTATKLSERQENISYSEMIPGSEDDGASLQMSKSSSTDLFTSTGVSSQYSTDASTSSIGSSQYVLQKYRIGEFFPEQQKQGRQSLFHISGIQETNQTEVIHMEEDFTNPVCSVCNNKRLKIGSKREFSYLDLYTATQGFSAKNFLSEGGFGAVYKGQLDGMPIAVKQHKKHSRSPLTWKDRIKVAIGAAKGLLYLHKNSIIHRDVRPNNILVTHDLQPLIGDFGLARTHNKDFTHSTEVVGTWGYLAPEYAEYGKVSSRTDARPLLKERNYPDLIDERIIDTHDYHQLFWMIRLAEKCLSRDPKKRLTMVEVVNALTDISDGNTCVIGTGDYTPAMSDSSYTSEPEFDENEDENGPYEDEFGELLSTISETTEGSDYTIQMRHMNVRQPPSPPIKNFYSSGSSSFQFSDESNSDYEAHNEKNLSSKFVINLQLCWTSPALSMVESQNPSILATMWRHHMGVWRKILPYRMKLVTAEIPKTVNDIRAMANMQ